MKLKSVLCLVLVLCMAWTLVPAASAVETYPALTPDGWTKIDFTGDGVEILSYTPTHSESHTFYTEGLADTYGILYDSEMNELAYSDDGTGISFLITWDLEAGKTYYLKVGYYSTRTTTCQVMTQINHGYGEPVITTPATCTADGIQTKTCTVCGKTAQETIPAIGHDWEDGTCNHCKETLLVSGTCGDNLQWVLDNTGTLTVSGTGAMSDYSGNDTPWYDHRESVKKVMIEDGVTSIGSDAFFQCTNLADIDIADSVTAIGEFAFFGCRSLQSVSISKNVTTIGMLPFFGCSNLTKIHVAEDNPSFSSDDQGALYNKDKTLLIEAPGAVETFVVPEGVVEIGSSAFYECKNLKTLTLPQTLKYIQAYAFQYCESLSEVTIPGTVKSFDAAFANCEGLTRVTVSEGVERISSTAFLGCYALADISIPDTVTSIGNTAFYACTGLTKITIPKSVTSIEKQAFYGCSGLAEISFSGNAPAAIAGDAFKGVTATAYYPTEDATWTEAVKQNYGGTITWTPTVTITDDDVIAVSNAASIFGEGSPAMIISLATLAVSVATLAVVIVNNKKYTSAARVKTKEDEE